MISPIVWMPQIRSYPQITQITQIEIGSNELEAGLLGHSGVSLTAAMPGADILVNAPYRKIPRSHAVTVDLRNLRNLRIFISA